MCRSKLSQFICRLIGCCEQAEGNGGTTVKGQGRAVWWFFGVVYMLTAALVLPILRSGQGVSTPANLLFMAAITWLPSLVGVVFIYLTRGRKGRRDFWQRTLHWPPQRWGASIASLAVLPALVFAAYALACSLSGTSLTFAFAQELSQDWRLFLQFLLVELIFGAVSEELGWRGYALDELEKKWSLLVASLVLGCLWALWHTPAFLIPGLSQYEMGGVFSLPYLSFTISVVCGSVIITRAYHLTGRSILVAGILMHFMFNLSITLLAGNFGSFSVPPSYWIVMPVVFFLAALGSVLLWRPRALRMNDASRLDAAPGS
jgi:membrane protease YdiL (CAAX protease family)